MRRSFLQIVLFFSLFGCNTSPSPKATAPVPQPPHADITASQDSTADLAKPNALTQPMNLQLYQFAMPYGANSNDSAFWKLVTEDLVDVHTNNLLDFNGLRVGRARISDWPQFFAALSRESAIKLSQTKILAQSGIGDALYGTTGQVPNETVFIFDDHGLTARSYEECVNRISFAFSRVPRRPGTVRITCAPVVIVPSSGNLQYVKRDNYYNLHFTADVDPGDFLIIGTSPKTEDPHRVGSLFMTIDGPNQRFEEILVLLGQPLPAGHLKTFGNPATRLSQGRFMGAQ